MFWFFSFCLLTLAVLFVLVPLLRQGSSAPEQESLRTATNLSLFEEREGELNAELAAGNLEQEQFDTLLLELQQSLLADVPEQDRDHRTAANSRAAKNSKKQTTAGPRARGSFGVKLLLPICCVALLPVFAYLAYDEWGYIGDVELMDLFQRTVDNVDDAEEAQRLIYSLGEVVQRDPARTWAHYFLAENLSSLGLFEQAESFYESAAELLDDNPDKAAVLSRVAMMKYINAEFELTPEVRAVIDQARAINPNEFTLLQLLSADAERNRDYSTAIQYWRLMIQANPNSQMAQDLRSRIATAQLFLGQQEPGAEAGPSVEVALSLGVGLQLNEDLRVFVAVRNAAREGLPPLAVTELRVADLPLTVSLDDSSSMVPAFNLSSADQIYVSALVSFAGDATPNTGDYRVVSDTIELSDGPAQVELVIADQVP